MFNFKMSPYLLNMILNDNFGNPDDTMLSTDLYIGLGIDFDEENFKFSKEPVNEGFTILPTPIAFEDTDNGILRNVEAIEWQKATTDWTTGSDTINYIGLYYNLNNQEESGSGAEINNAESTPNYKLVMVLPLAPSETVLTGERMVLNANSILIKLANR